MKWAKQRDINEPQIIEALEHAGAAVQRLDGTGVPDLLVSYQGVLTLIEVKRPLGAKGGKHHHGHGGVGDLTAAQVKWHQRWKGKAPVVVRNEDEALAAIGVAR